MEGRGSKLHENNDFLDANYLPKARPKVPYASPETAQAVSTSPEGRCPGAKPEIILLINNEMKQVLLPI